MRRLAAVSSVFATTAVLAFGATAPASAYDVDPTFFGGTYLGQAADAEAMRPWQGAGFRTLFAAQDGTIFYGYGNYDKNSGSKSGLGTNVSYFDASDGLFKQALTSMPGEQIDTFRSFGGKVFVPNIDPTSGTVAIATNVNGTWSYRNNGMEHIFDVMQGLDANDILISGSANIGGVPTALVKRSRDGGATWIEVYRWQDAPSDRDGYERVYWMSRIGGNVYWRADVSTRGAQAPMTAFALSTGRLTKLGDTKLGTGWTGSNGRQLYVGEAIYEADRVVSANNLIYLVEQGSVYWFDGAKTGVVTKTTTGYPYGADRITVDPVTNTVYVLDQGGISVVTGKTKALIKPLQADYNMNTSNEFAVYNGVAYLGGDDSKLYSLPL